MSATLPTFSKIHCPLSALYIALSFTCSLDRRTSSIDDGRAAEVGADLQEVGLVGAGLGRALPHRGGRRRRTPAAAAAGAAALEERRQRRRHAAARRRRGGSRRQEEEAAGARQAESEEPPPEAGGAGGEWHGQEGVPDEGRGPGRRAAVAEGARRLLRALRHLPGRRRRRWRWLVVAAAAGQEAVGRSPCFLFSLHGHQILE